MHWSTVLCNWVLLYFVWISNTAPWDNITNGQLVYYYHAHSAIFWLWYYWMGVCRSGNFNRGYWIFTERSTWNIRARRKGVSKVWEEIMKCDTCFCNDPMGDCGCNHYPEALSIWQRIRICIFGCKWYIEESKYLTKKVEWWKLLINSWRHIENRTAFSSSISIAKSEAFVFQIIARWKNINSIKRGNNVRILEHLHPLKRQRPMVRE